MHPRSLSLAILVLTGCTSGSPDATLGAATDPAPAPAPPGPPAFGAPAGPSVAPIAMGPLHGCTKLRYSTLGNVLRALGVPMDPSVAGSAAELCANGADAMGVARYADRVREALKGSTASSEKRDDVFTLAAAEIHAMDKQGAWNAPACAGVALFDGAHDLSQGGVSCLMGKPARADHVSLARSLVADVIAAADPGEKTTDARDRGERIAIATILSAAHGCE